MCDSVAYGLLFSLMRVGCRLLFGLVGLVCLIWVCLLWVCLLRLPDLVDCCLALVLSVAVYGWRGAGCGLGLVLFVTVGLMPCYCDF